MWRQPLHQCLALACTLTTAHAINKDMHHYCESLNTAMSQRRKKDSFDIEVDFIVVGAGSSGCAVASRLAQGMKDKKVLLVEAGDTDDLPQIQTAVDYFGKAEKIFGSERDWSYHAEAQPELGGRALYWPRGKVVGGCSSFNTMVYLRGDPNDYDHWYKMLGKGFEAWTAKGMLPYFKRAETHPGNDAYHGKEGPMKVAPLTHKLHFSTPEKDGAAHFVTEVFIKAAQKLQIAFNGDFARQTEGVGVNDVNASGGRRCNTSSYLKMIGAYPTTLSTVSTNPPGSLHVWLCAVADRILFDNNKRAIGLEIKLTPREDSDDDENTTQYREFDGKKISGRSNQVRIRARNEVIVCGGAVNSPVLLMRSGLGPEKHLQDMDIPLVKDMPGVGSNLKDHMHVPMCYRLKNIPVKPHSHSNICEGSLFTKLDPKAPSPDLQVHVGTIFFEPDGFSPLGEGFTLTPSLIHPKSQGTIRLQSKDLDDKPIITANYLSDPEGYDLKQLVEGIKFVRTIGNQMLREFGNQGIELHPGSNYQTDAELEDYVRKFAGSMYHPACTCRMGQATDPLAVLNPKMQVWGIEGLRVIDASSIPELPGANTNATCIALGEKGADIILQDYGRSL